MLRLDFTYADLGLRETSEKTRRSSVSGVQEKVQLKRVRGGFEIVSSGGDFILKPAPRNTTARRSADVPVNEHLTMQVASRVFGVRTAENELVALADIIPRATRSWAFIRPPISSNSDNALASESRRCAG